MYQQIREKLHTQPKAMADNCESQLYHAIAEAERLLLDYNLESQGHLPWGSSEAMFVWETIGRTPKCFYVDLNEHEIF